MKRIVSGMQPTGNLHLGNYVGALKNWVALQEENECLFFMVDLHALTTHHDPRALQMHIRQGAALYIAAGIDPEKSTIFQQSAIAAHCELMWILSCFTPLGWLNRMTQFKEKSAKMSEFLGLYAYPVLMAADILLYQATHVPVGEDQKQHLELTRDLAAAVNHHYGDDLFVIPQPMILKEGSRIMSLQNGLKKMSKSDSQEGSRINLLDSPEVIAHKIKRAKTDADLFPEDPESLELRPEVENLITLYAALEGTTAGHVCKNFGGQGFSTFKKSLVDLMITVLSPLQERYHHLMKDPKYLDQILDQGAKRANILAQQTLSRVKNSVGL